MLLDYYNILCLNPDATTDQIKKAFRLKAKLCHPDACRSPEAANEFIRLKEAFNSLMQIRHAEDIRRQQEYFHPHDPYFQHTHVYHTTHAQNHRKSAREDQQEADDFLHSKIGYALYLSMHVLFLFTGFVVLLSPLYTLITRGFDRYGSLFYSIFNVIVAMTFGVIMIVKISGSFFRFIKKSF